MQVFKTFFKIVYKNIGQLSIFLVVFIILSILLVSQGGATSNLNLEDKKVNIAFFSKDRSEFVEGFKKYLLKYTNIKEIEDTKEGVQDALYYREVEYIVRVPDNFTEGLFNGNNNVKVEKISVAGATTGAFLDLAINKYLNGATTYINSIPDISIDKLQQYLDEDTSKKVDYEIKTYNEQTTNAKAKYYFTYYAYIIFAVMILGITSIMLSFNNLDLRRRNLSSPIKITSYNMQLVLGSFLFMLICWIIISIMGVALYGIDILNSTTLLLYLNSFIISLVALSIAFFVGNFIKNKNTQSAIANILSLGMCFLSGVFVPQELISEGVLKIASFLPTYWYVKAVNAINSLTVWNNQNIMPIVYSILIQLGFALAVLLMSLVIIRQKRTSSQ